MGKERSAGSRLESVAPLDIAPRSVAREFRAHLDAGVELQPAGEARDDPSMLLDAGYLPRYKLELFGTRFYLAAPRRDPAVRFFVAYLLPPAEGSRRRVLYPRIFYKDLSLVWRVASHLVASEDEFWIGKGAVECRRVDGYEFRRSVESTTDLPLEIQTAVERLNHAPHRVSNDDDALYLVLRNAPPGRIEPYRDFTAPREAAAARPGGRIHGGRPIAWFRRKNVPESLTFVRGFAPDLRHGVIERSISSSRLYGGSIRRYRILSENRRIQYLFFASPHHVWIVPPQTTTTELSTYGVRTVDVHADEDLFVPGYEYHYLDGDPEEPELVSQIPPGFAGPQAEFDPTRADASPWLDALPIVRQFRRTLGRARL